MIHNLILKRNEWKRKQRRGWLITDFVRNMLRNSKFFQEMFSVLSIDLWKSRAALIKYSNQALELCCSERALVHNQRESKVLYRSINIRHYNLWFIAHVKLVGRKRPALMVTRMVKTFSFFYETRWYLEPNEWCHNKSEYEVYL